MASTAANRREQLRRQQEAQARQKRTFRIVGVAAAVLALVLVGVLIAVVIQGRGSSAATGAQVVPPNANADRTGIVVNSTPAPEGAPVVTLYLDYQCPNCRTFENSVGGMLEESANAGDWTLQYKTMLFMDKNLANTASTRAAIAAACSDVAGHYSEYHRAIYANQELQEVRGSVGYPDELLRDQLPGQVGIAGDALTAFQSCYDTRATSDFVAGVDRGAYTDGVTGTPTLAVNGKILDLSKLTDPSPAGLRQYILDNA